MNLRNDLKRVLHVDDEEDIRTITRLALDVVGGLDLLQCASGQNAVDEVEDFDPDLILLDYMMPIMDGEATLKRLREIPSLITTPVVFMTARAEGGMLKKLANIGALDVISKPFDPMTLCAQLQDLWNNRD